ncbi:MAG: terminase family protein [Maricaulis sp.]|jgi:phage terminase large subunit-like protein|nr:terminase family protein [Maricaulis sp.]
MSAGWQRDFLKTASQSQIERIGRGWLTASEPPQLALPDAWLIWLFMGGRGAGKTRAGAEWVAQRVIEGCRRIALVAPTFGDVREVMMEGPSGLLHVGPTRLRPHYEVSRKRVVWDCGAVGYGFSAEDADGLRGPQFDCAWGDEFAAWKEPQAVLDTLRMGLRLGTRPQLMLTTTPRPIQALKELVAQAKDQTSRIVVSHQSTAGNAAHLAPGFVDAMQASYGRSGLGRQELEGLLVDDPPGALWQRDPLEASRIETAPELDRIVVAVDPPATGGPRADECGIVVAGACGAGVSRRAFVLADLSFGPALPAVWAAAVARGFEAWQADCVIAEANQGGEMVRSVLMAADAGLPIRLVHATRGKHVRAEPIAALYAAGRVRHADRFEALEDQMCAFGAPDGPRSSPDRVDALVWAITDLLMGRGGAPRLRQL